MSKDFDEKLKQVKEALDHYRKYCRGCIDFIRVDGKYIGGQRPSRIRWDGKCSVCLKLKYSKKKTGSIFVSMYKFFIKFILYADR